jgi:hypothetical protein
LKLDESQRKRRESLFNTAYSVVKTGKPFSDYELICEIQLNFADVLSGAEKKFLADPSPGLFKLFFNPSLVSDLPSPNL